MHDCVIKVCHYSFETGLYIQKAGCFVIDISPPFLFFFLPFFLHGFYRNEGRRVERVAVIKNGKNVRLNEANLHRNETNFEEFEERKCVVDENSQWCRGILWSRTKSPPYLRRTPRRLKTIMQAPIQDRRRFNGPSGSSHLVYSSSQSTSKLILNSENKREDGRALREVRPICE